MDGVEAVSKHVCLLHVSHVRRLSSRIMVLMISICGSVSRGPQPATLQCHIPKKQSFAWAKWYRRALELSHEAVQQTDR